MINLWYDESYWAYTGGKLTGPEEVVRNTIAALEKENVEFAINEDRYSYNFLMQYQHAIAHQRHENLEHSSCVIGPQFWPYDESYGKFLIENPQYYKKLIAPGYWVEDMLVNRLNVPPDKVAIWPAPIPSFNQNKVYGKYDCLIYFKSRSDEELEIVKDFLDSKGKSYKVIQYGNYKENEFIDEVFDTKFCFILDSTESQGIAIQKIMSTNTPLLVWDVKEWVYMGEEYKVPASSVPYWSDDCGERFYDVQDMEETFDRFCAKIGEYTPRKLIESELSYKVSIKKLLAIFNED